MLDDWKTRDNGTMIRKFGHDEAMILPRAGGRFFCYWIRNNNMALKPFAITNGLEEAQHKCIEKAQEANGGVKNA